MYYPMYHSRYVLPIIIGFVNSVMSIPLSETYLRFNPYDKDGCCVSCGYTWCPDLEECVRVWETYCKSLEN